MIKHTKERLEAAISQNKTWSDVCRDLGLKPRTGSQTHLKNRAVYYGIDFTHFTGTTRGKRFGWKRPLEDYLTNKAAISSAALRRKLISSGIKENKCEMCGLKEWLERPIPLELDHINSVHTDNRLENLQILCPNCHALKTMPE
jgi:hypothetical protein